MWQQKWRSNTFQNESSFDQSSTLRWTHPSLGTDRLAVTKASVRRHLRNCDDHTTMDEKDITKAPSEWPVWNSLSLGLTIYPCRPLLTCTAWKMSIIQHVSYDFDAGHIAVMDQIDPGWSEAIVCIDHFASKAEISFVGETLKGKYYTICDGQVIFDKRSYLHEFCKMRSF